MAYIRPLICPFEMPQDSIHLSVNSNDIDQQLTMISDSLHLDSLRRQLSEELARQTAIDKHNTNLSVGIVALVLVFLVLYPLVRGWIRRSHVLSYIKKEFVLNGPKYDVVLALQNAYYKNLDQGERDRFLKRLIHFLKDKKFEYVGMDPIEEVPILVGGAAIQLTFGLRGYLMEYFETIYLLKEDYYFGYYQTPFQGHVNNKGIYLSWNNFLKGYENYSDGQNLGLHEMAHALAYVNFSIASGEDDEFQNRFKIFSKTARPIFGNMQKGNFELLDKYGATDYNEFWAVSVETFFEEPEQFYRKMPDLYLALCSLLNQDPRERVPVIVSSEAGETNSL
ncbi:MAG: hypothetical protein C5B52_04810 [Bacteroidetes bacterium]|nr:MAG: hypothetical protein C5B52_04810 [Bacteroidota bacterium]